jgi:hypothetical protein
MIMENSTLMKYPFKSRHKKSISNFATQLDMKNYSIGNEILERGISKNINPERSVTVVKSLENFNLQDIRQMAN